MLSERDAFFESLYRDNFNKLKIQAHLQLDNLPVAEELAQETLLKALQDYETLVRHENPSAYLRKVLKYKILEYKRTRCRYLKLFLSLDSASLDEAKAPSNSIPTSVSSILETARNALTKEEWYILEQFVLNNASHLEIAKKLGISVQASQKRLERARKKLEDVLPDY